MVRVRAAVTAAVVIVNEAEFWPEGMLTKEGAFAVGSLYSKVTFAPPIGALSAMVTVPPTLFPPTTELLA